MRDVMTLAGTGPHAPLAAPAAQAWLPQLSRATLLRLPPAVRRPRFDSALLRPGILHLGCGAFHRAHQALLTQEAIEAEAGPGAPPPWGIVGVSLRDAAVVHALDRQDGLYTVLERGATGNSATVVASVCRRVFAPEQPAMLRRLLAGPELRIVTLTVTPAGYCIDPVTGRLDSYDPLIVSDLQTPYPRTAIGVLVRAFADRRAAGMQPPVVMSCDNLASNSRVLRQMCVDFAALRDDRLACWIAGHVQFAATMVDRIVPAPTADDRFHASTACGLEDGAAVSAEPFRQWVIERFDGPRPRWEAAGAQFVGDIAPWEASKLRLLNGGHLALTFLGQLAGCATVAETVALPGCAGYLRRFMCDEQKPTLPPSDHDIDAYAGQLIERWKNPATGHRLMRVGRDASAKLAARLLTPLAENRNLGRPAPCTVLAIAAWMRCAAGVDDLGRPFAVDDVQDQRLRMLATETGADSQALVERLLRMAEIFGFAAAEDVPLRRDLVRAVQALHTYGARAALASQSWE